MPIGILTIHLIIPGCSSLKEKRRHLKPLLHRIHREFNVSIAEISLQDAWAESKVTAVNVCNDAKYIQSELNKIILYIKNNYKDMDIASETIEII
jgi:uncharacterized protein YlxP (DUF503 family)